MSCPDHSTSAAQAEPCIPFLSSLPSPLKSIIHCQEQRVHPCETKCRFKNLLLPSPLLQPLTKYPTPHHHDPYFSSLDVLGSSASHFTLARLRASSQGQRPSCLWQALQKLFEEPGEKQDSTVPALCCSTMLGLPAASVAVLGNAKRDLLLSAFIRDNTNQVQPVAA